MSKLGDSGLTLLNEIEGSGVPAKKGAVVRYACRLFLRRGDEVTFDPEVIEKARAHVDVTEIDGVELIVHTAPLGRRQPIAGVEKSLYGMKRGGYREVLVSPHLAYGEVGVEDRIPGNALLRIQLWVEDVQFPE